MPPCVAAWFHERGRVGASKPHGPWALAPRAAAYACQLASRRAIKALRRQSRDVLYKRRHRLLRGPKPSDKRRNKLWFADRSRNVARAAEARWRAAERQRTLIAAWEDALERRRSGPGRA
jgi:hypothetical protein